MSAPNAPRRAVDLDALAGTIADSLQGPTYCLDGQVGGGDGFVTFDAETLGSTDRDPAGATVRATVSLVSDGEGAIEGAAGEVFEIVVRRVNR